MKSKGFNKMWSMVIVFLALVLTPNVWAQENVEASFNISQTLSEQAQRTTIAFDGLAFITGDMCSDSFLPPGKIADFFGFQFLRDNDSDEMGHNTDFLTRISNNVLYILTDSQVAELVTLAESQVTLINDYGYKRFPLMKAFRRLLEGDIPTGSEGLDLDAVMAYSAEIYRIDGLISYQRAEVLGGIIRNLSQSQIDYLDTLASQGMLSWPTMGNQVDPRDYSHDVHVAIMTYASQLFSWYAGSVEGDVYFCPERQGTYFGSFYLKDMPAMGNPNYTISPNLTADSGNAFLNALTTSQAALISGLVDTQWDDLNEIVATRQLISEELRRFMTEDSVSSNTVLQLAELYGQLDGRIVYHFATNFAEVGQTITSTQMAELMDIRDLDDYPCSGAYLYSDNIGMPTIQNTDFLFTSDSSSGNPGIELSRTEMNFSMTVGATTDAQTFTIANSGEGTLNWTASSNVSWLSVSPTSGTDSGTVSVSVNNTQSPGSYTGTVTVADTSGYAALQTVSVSLEVIGTGSGAVPFGEFSTPLDGSSSYGSIPVTGWALDDVEVKSVKIYNGSAYIGDAVFVEGARPDVESLYPTYPLNYRAGWGYMLLTHFLPNGGNGTYTLVAKATDVEGNEVTLGSKTINLNNSSAVKPFGAIDSPTPGGTASGIYTNVGWTLTPMPNKINENGRGIDVYVDGAKVGSPTYNLYRSDIASLFPGYANSNGAMAKFQLDTTDIPNGLHTISWVVTDEGGNSDGVGSRYFKVTNAATSRGSASSRRVRPSLSAMEIRTLPSMESGAIYVRQGVHRRAGLNRMENDGSGVYNIRSSELNNLEIRLGEEESEWQGYMLAGKGFTSLPIGSTLAEDSETFLWQPGPGFYGDYHLVFVKTDAEGTRKRMLINVNIAAK
ncbi:MAG: BACON domain-containing protein [bacterium]|nr:BACON domain-containing protein [bacterium]